MKRIQYALLLIILIVLTLSGYLYLFGIPQFFYHTIVLSALLLLIVWPFVLVYQRQQQADIDRLKEAIQRLTQHDLVSVPVILDKENELYSLGQGLYDLQQSTYLERHKRQRQSANYHAMLENLPVGILVINDEHQIFLVNDAAKELLKLSRQVALPTPFYSLISEFDILRLIRQSKQNHQSQTEIVTLSNQRQVEVKVILHPIGQDDQEEILVMLYDLTTLLTVKRMQADFLANVSHEFKTPLTAISGFVETLQGSAGDNQAFRQKFLTIIHEQTDRLTAMVNDVLTLSSVAQKPLEPVNINVKSTIDQTLLHLDAERIAKNIQVTQHLFMDQITIDYLTWQTLLTNLLTNAVKYNQINGQVIITVKQKERQVILTIQDTGIGIPSGQQERIFERFYRGDESRQRQIADGTGLGLAIVKELVDKLEGQIQLQSQVGVGTTVTVSLPII